MAAEKIRNVGPKSAAWLRQVGVRTIEDLKREGAVDTFLKVKRAGFRPSLNLLYSMEGALVDCHWTDLSAERKAQLVTDYEAAESDNPIRTRWEKQVNRSLELDGDGSDDPSTRSDGDHVDADGDSRDRETNGGDGDGEFN
ncbi:MAG: TfoX/Sxy family protein [Dokdonella sp.]